MSPAAASCASWARRRSASRPRPRAALGRRAGLRDRLHVLRRAAPARARPDPRRRRRSACPPRRSSSSAAPSAPTAASSTSAQLDSTKPDVPRRPQAQARRGGALRRAVGARQGSSRTRATSRTWPGWPEGSGPRGCAWRCCTAVATRTSGRSRRGTSSPTTGGDALPRAKRALDRHRLEVGIENHKDWQRRRARRADPLGRQPVPRRLRRLRQQRLAARGPARHRDPRSRRTRSPRTSRTWRCAPTSGGFELSEVPLGTGICPLAQMIEVLRSARPEAPDVPGDDHARPAQGPVPRRQLLGELRRPGRGPHRRASRRESSRARVRSRCRASRG